MEAADETSKVPVCETTWLQNVVDFVPRKLQDGTVILAYTLGNGHQYCLPLKGQLLTLTQRAVSPVALPGDSPSNGHGAIHLT